MKKILIILVFFLLVYLYWLLNAPRTSPVYLLPEDKISMGEKPKPNHELYSIISHINKNNALIKDLYIEDMPIRFQQKKLSVKVYGELALKKEKCFRLKISHKITGLEVDVGSNEQYFWYWSKRLNSSLLNYAKNEEIGKTMLRTALNPAWIMESMNVGLISTENIEISKFKEFWAVIQQRKGASEEPVKVIILIDPKQRVVVGRYLYNQENLIASAEYQDFYNNVPRKILIIWHEEEIILDLDLSDIQINSGINSKFWIMPEKKYYNNLVK